MTLPPPLVVLLGALSAAPDGTGALGVDGTTFTVDGRCRFLLGVSYYGALGAPEETVRGDLDDFAALGLDWVRVWATWASNGENVSAVDARGEPREPFVGRLVALVAEARTRGIVVDVTLSRGTLLGEDEGLAELDSHRRAAETIAIALKGYDNVYIDIANERNVGDSRFVPFEELGAVRAAIRSVDPDRLATASHGGDISRAECDAYIATAGVDFLTPHRPRHPESPGETEGVTRAYLRWMDEARRARPIHYQEPFRRDYGSWQPSADDFLTDLRGAIRGGAAGWCLHNGAPPRESTGLSRCFDLRRGNPRLMHQLDEDELAVLRAMARVASEEQAVGR